MNHNKLNRNSRHHFVAKLALSLLVAGPLMGHAKADGEGPTPVTQSGQIAATVNAKSIYMTQVDQLTEQQLNKQRRFNMSGSHPAQVNIIRKKILEQLIDRELLRQASQKEPVADLEKKLEQEIEFVQKQYGGKEKLQSHTPSGQMSDKEYENFIREKVQRREYLKKHGVLEPEISEKRLRDFYERGKNSFKTDEFIKVSHILLSAPQEADPAVKNEALKKAQSLRQAIIDGRDFADAAKEHSASEEAKESGGDLGFLRKGYMPAAFDNVAFTLQPGELSQPVATRFGYHIIKVTDRKPASFTPFEKVRDFIRKYIQENEEVKNMAAHMQKLRQEADIVIVSSQPQPLKPVAKTP